MHCSKTRKVEHATDSEFKQFALRGLTTAKLKVRVVESDTNQVAED